jgi:hypothetical protein
LAEALPPRRIACGALAALLLLTGCGSSIDEGESGRGREVANAKIVVRDADGRHEATLRCFQGGAEGTGAYESDPHTGCTRLNIVRSTLTAPPNARTVCGARFFGPEEATITGAFDGERFTRRLSRTNACEEQDWQLVYPLLAPVLDG